LIPIPFEHSGTSVANEEDETLRQAGIERFDAKMTAPTREATLNAVAFQTLGGSRRIRELDAMPEKTGPAKLVRAVDYHKGIGISLIHSSFGGRYDLAKNVSYALGYSISVKGLANNFGYDNTTFDHLGCFDWWMDISFTNLFVRHDHLSGNEFKFGMNHCFDFYSHNDLIVELGVLGEFGWYRLGETKFRAEPSAELGMFPHQTGLKILARWLLAPDLHSLDLGVAWDATRVLDGVVDLVDRLLLGI
jgi:hypothetical protein